MMESTFKAKQRPINVRNPYGFKNSPFRNSGKNKTLLNNNLPKLDISY